MISPYNQNTLETHVHVKTKTLTSVSWVTDSSLPRQYIAIGY